MKELNETISIYRVAEDCCAGYHRDSQGHCVKTIPTGQIRDGDEEKVSLTISHGAYAGIVCGILFVLSVALLTALHYRKRKMRQAKMKTLNLEQDVSQRQTLVPLETMTSSITGNPTVDTPVST